MTTSQPNHLARTRWRKSSRSHPYNDCVEVAFDAGTVRVRDSKLGRNSPVLDFPACQWRRFLHQPPWRTELGVAHVSAAGSARNGPATARIPRGWGR